MMRVQDSMNSRLSDEHYKAHMLGPHQSDSQNI
jgi:hypothetical protein